MFSQSETGSGFANRKPMPQTRWLLFLLTAFLVAPPLLARSANLNRCQSVFFDKYYPGAVPFKTYQIDGVTYLETARLQIEFTKHSFEVYEKTSGDHAGHMDYFLREEKTAHLPVYTKEKFHGLGYGSEFRFAVLKWIFLTTDIQRVFAQIAATNEASLSLNKKLGFKETSHGGNIIYFHLEKEDFLKIDSENFFYGNFTKPRSKLVQTPIPHLNPKDKMTEEKLRQMYNLVRDRLNGTITLEASMAQNARLTEAIENLKMPENILIFERIFDQINPQNSSLPSILSSLEILTIPPRGLDINNAFYSSFSNLCVVIQDQLIKDAAARNALVYTYSLQKKK